MISWEHFKTFKYLYTAFYHKFVNLKTKVWTWKKSRFWVPIVSYKILISQYLHCHKQFSVTEMESGTLWNWCGWTSLTWINRSIQRSPSTASLPATFRLPPCSTHYNLKIPLSSSTFVVSPDRFTWIGSTRSLCNFKALGCSGRNRRLERWDKCERVESICPIGWYTIESDFMLCGLREHLQLDQRFQAD